MDIQLFPEKTKQTSFKNKVIAYIAIIISAPINWLSPEKIEKIFNILVKKNVPATVKEAETARNAICVVSKRCRSQEGCLRRSIGVFFYLFLKRKSISWCTGYKMDPFNAHAWVELDGVPVNELNEIQSYIKTVEVKPSYLSDEKNTNYHNTQKKKSSNVTVKDLFLLAKGQKKQFYIISVLGLISAVLTLIQPSLVSNIIEESQKNLKITNTNTLFLLIGILMSSTILTAFQYYKLQTIGEEVIYKARVDLISHLLRLPINEYDHRSKGDLLSVLSGDTSKLRLALIQVTVSLSSGLIIVVGASVSMFFRDRILFLLTILTVLVAFSGIVLVSKSIQKTSFLAQKKLGELSGGTERNLHAIRTIRSTNATSNEEIKLINSAESIKKIGMKLAKIQSWMIPISNMSLQLSGILILGMGGYRVSLGFMKLSDLIAFSLLLYMVIGPIGQIFNSFSGIGESLGSFKRIQELLNLELEGQDDNVEYGKKVANKNIDNNTMVFFENINFKYNPEKSFDNLILKNLSLKAKKGEITAVVGPSGAGKSTLLQLIERFYDTTSGHIYIDGVRQCDLTREELREKITYVEQDAPIISGTLRDNLTLGNENTTDRECIEVLNKVNLGNLISRGNKGLDMDVGENGASISGGEKQRIAMARSLLSNADIILLDELTSNLDSINELGMKNTIAKLKGKKTIIVVAHRLSTVVEADVIYVLEHGRVIGFGNHDDLLSSIPLYKELAKEQFLDKKLND